MKIIIILGTGNSGASALNDYLLSREDFQSLFNAGEFRLVNDPDGVDELYNSFYKNFSINGSANALENFKEFLKNIQKSNYNKKYPIYNEKFDSIANEYLKNIVKLRYNGSPQFYLDKLSIYKKLKFYFKRLILRESLKNTSLLNMITPCDEKSFIEYSHKFIFDIFKSLRNFDDKKNIVIEQGGNFINPVSSTKYYGESRKVIVVLRNPKAIFWSMKRRNSPSYPGHDVSVFVNWYKEIMSKINSHELNKVIKIKFEDFFENFEKNKSDLSIKLGIDPNAKYSFNLDHTLKNLHKYKNKLSKYEIDYIDENLKDFI